MSSDKPGPRELIHDSKESFNLVDLLNHLSNGKELPVELVHCQFVVGPVIQ